MTRSFATYAKSNSKSVLAARFLSKLALALLILAATALSSSASQSDVYIGQSASGAADGSSCANQLAASFFNSGSNWGNGGTQIGPGTTVHLCGTITSALNAQGSGANGNTITIQWEKGASLSVCNSTAALQVSTKSYFTIDLGGNSAAITCPNNGTGLGSGTNAVGISANGNWMSHIEIRNGTIGPLYKYSCCGSDGLNSVAISLFGGTNNHFHDLILNNANQGFSFQLGNNISSSGNEINNNNCASTIGRCIDYSNGDGSNVTDTAGKIHDNDITFGDGWYSGGGDFTHLESIRSFNYGGSNSNDHIVGELIYNNYIHGNSTGDATSFIFIPEGLSSCSSNSTLSAKIYNNLMVLTGGGGPGDGFIFTQDCEHTLEIYNNTIDGKNNSQMICMEIEGSQTTVTFKNNICENVQTMIYNAHAGPTLIADTNNYFNVGTHGSNGWYWQGQEYETLQAWQAATGQDKNSVTVNPGLNADYTIPAGSAVAGLGVNLTSLAALDLDESKPITVGPGAESASTVARLGSGNWDLGAYSTGLQSSNPPPTPLAPPTGLAVLSVQ
ncbi:MAG TPA: hypothetical protein VGJ06_15695 [Candidatus Acidoferrum sp.]|jgi:hypothetical protein